MEKIMKSFWEDLNEILQSELWKKNIAKEKQLNGGWKHVEIKSKNELEQVWANFKQEMRILNNDLNFTLLGLCIA